MNSKRQARITKLQSILHQSAPVQVSNTSQFSSTHYRYEKNSFHWFVGITITVLGGFISMCCTVSYKSGKTTFDTEKNNMVDTIRYYKDEFGYYKDSVEDDYNKRKEMETKDAKYAATLLFYNAGSLYSAPTITFHKPKHYH